MVVVVGNQGWKFVSREHLKGKLTVRVDVVVDRNVVRLLVFAFVFAFGHGCLQQPHVLKLVSSVILVVLTLLVSLMSRLECVVRVEMVG